MFIAPFAAGYGLARVFYAVVVIFNRIPIRATIIDIKRVGGAYQLKRLGLRPLARIIFPIISNRVRRCRRDRRAQLALSDRRRLQHDSRILIDIADSVFSLNILNVYIAVQMPRPSASNIFSRTSGNTDKTEFLVANFSRPFNLAQRNGHILFMVNVTNGIRRKPTFIFICQLNTICMYALPDTPIVFGVRHICDRNSSDGIPSVLIQNQPVCIARNLHINIHGSTAIGNRRLLIPAAGNSIRQRAHRHQIDEHQRRHQNGYKAFYFIPHCLILLFHLEAALPLLPERSKRICGQTVRRLKKRFGKNGRVIPARRFPPCRRRRAAARSGQRGDSSN